jgi:hypothetical protein
MAAVATNASRKKMSVDFLKCTPAVGTSAAFTLQGIGTSRWQLAMDPYTTCP